MPDETIPAAVGSDATLPADAPATVPATESPPAEAKPEEGHQPEAKPAGEPAPEPVKAPEAEPKGDAVTVKPRKAGPIAGLLAKKHESDARAQAAEEKAAKLEAKLAELSQSPQTPATNDKIKALADKYGLEAEVLNDIVAAARDGMSPQLPQEVQDLIAERNLSKAQADETRAFDNRVERLAKLFPNEPIKAQRERLMQLAYSEDAAPDGERYIDKELSEIYFGYIKPEAEPGKASGEAGASAGTRASQPPSGEPDDAWSMSDEEFKRKQDEVRASG